MTFSDFFDRVGNLDWVAVLVGTLVVMVLGMIWYGPLFGKKWSAETGMPMMSMTKMPEPSKLLGGFISAFVLSAAVNYFGALDDIEHSMVLALLLGVFVGGSYMYSQVVWAGKKMSVFLIDIAFAFVAITIVSYVQGLLA